MSTEAAVDGVGVLRLGGRRERGVQAFDRRSVVVEAGEELGPGEERRPARARRASSRAAVVGVGRRGRRRRRSGTASAVDGGVAVGVARARRRRARAHVRDAGGLPRPSVDDQQRDGDDRHDGARDEPTGLGHEPMIGGDAVGTRPVGRSARVPRSARRAVLATIAPDGRPRLVPICFVVADERADPLHADRRQAETGRRPAGARPRPRHRGRPAGDDPRRSLGRGLDAARLAPRRGARDAPRTRRGAREHAAAVAALRAKYPQYATHRLEERPLIRIEIDRVVDWGPDARG